MKKSKNYFTVEELQTICEKLGLSTEGSKNELVQKILDAPPVDISLDQYFDAVDSSNVSRVVFQRAKILPAIQPLDEKFSPNLPTKQPLVNTPNL